MIIRWTQQAARFGCLLTLFGSLGLNSLAAQQSILNRTASSEKESDVSEVSPASLSKARLISDGPSDAEQILLRYDFKLNEDIRWTIEQIATTEISSQGNRQSSRMRAVSTRKWHVTEVDDSGHITFEQSIEDALMASKTSERPEVRFDSRSSDPIPPEFEAVAAQIGKVVATFTVSPYGTVIKRESDLPPQDLGLGDVVIPFPEQAIRVGAVWDNEGSLQAVADNVPVQIKTRQRYYLKEVQDGIAYITVQTQVITPIRDARIRAQIMQQMTSGMIMFDLSVGRVWKQEIEWDEEVQGFSSADSIMKYNALYTETLRGESEDVAASAFEAGRRTARSPFTSSEAIRIPGDRPIIRR